jgi:molecular chaperone GrpE
VSEEKEKIMQLMDEEVDAKKVNAQRQSHKEKELDKWREEANHWKNEYYMSFADVQNLRKSIEADHKESIKYRAEGFIIQLIPILDNFQIALSNEAKNEELKNYLIGFNYVYHQILDVLKNEGVEVISPKVGQEFDVNTMHAVDVDNTPNTDVKENCVCKIISDGYKLKDHLIKPAQVIVKKTVAAKENESAESHRA